MTATTPHTAEASRPLRKDAARNRALLLEAARVVFAQRGLDASLDDIARQAGVGVGTAYRHFANKYDLATALMDETIDRIVGAAEHAQANPDARAGLLEFLEVAMSAQAVDRGLRQVLMGVHDPERMADVHRRITDALTDIVGRAKESGYLRPNVAPSDVGMVVIMLCTVADVAADLSPGLWRRYLGFCLDGLCIDSDYQAAKDVPALSDEQLRSAMMQMKTNPASRCD